MHLKVCTGLDANCKLGQVAAGAWQQAAVVLIVDPEVLSAEVADNHPPADGELGMPLQTRQLEVLDNPASLNPEIRDWVAKLGRTSVRVKEFQESVTHFHSRLREFAAARQARWPRQRRAGSGGIINRLANWGKPYPQWVRFQGVEHEASFLEVLGKPAGRYIYKSVGDRQLVD